jgi:GNAT superfamily N-acetyltransferase
MSIVLRELEWSQIYSIWRKNLWPNRTTPIETHSAMLYKGGHDMENFRFKVDFLGCFKDNKLVGINSGHKTMDGGYRSRGLWVHPDHRGLGIGQILLRQIIEYRSNSFFVWSYPRQTSWNTYKAVGFQLASDWQASDTSEANAYCILHR